MQTETAIVIDVKPMQGAYNLLLLRAPGIAPAVRPGQFVHARVPHLGESVLRRPFSVFRTDGDTLSVLFKAVGRGTRALQQLRPGETVSLIGPLGRGFPDPSAETLPVIVAGGYGMAALYMTARQSARKGVAFFGGRSAQDILCVREFEALGWTVRVATEDGSMGDKGLVTGALDGWMKSGAGGDAIEFFCCGPNGLLKAVAARAVAAGAKAWVSMDSPMACGVGACLTCVVKVASPEPPGWAWARSCREGPVFECREIVWEAVR